ncbi:hypothetical protein TNCV_4477611 [Trichonephila clavipes]|nr:hypothetical protein TNCV_4477611 [Trichonephila clavipes]
MWWLKVTSGKCRFKLISSPGRRRSTGPLGTKSSLFGTLGFLPKRPMDKPALPAGIFRLASAVSFWRLYRLRQRSEKESNKFVGCGLVFYHCRPSTFPETVSLFSAAPCRWIPIAAVIFTPRFLHGERLPSSDDANLRILRRGFNFAEST